MRLFKGSIERIKSGNIRVEEDLTNIIDEFFSNQPNIEKYEIVEKKNIKDILNQENELTGIAGELKWVVDVYGDVHLYEEDLINGDLFFKIRMLTGNLYCHCKHIKPSVIPTKIYGEIVFVPDEEEQWKNRQQDSGEDTDLSMGLISTTPITKAKVKQKLSAALTDMIFYNYDIDIDSLINQINNDLEKSKSYKIVIKTHKTKPTSTLLVYDIYLSEDGNAKPLKISAVEKAFYLAYIMFEEGTYLEDIPYSLIETAKKIYSLMSDKRQDDENGLMSDDFYESDNLNRTLNSNRSHIRSAISEIISNKKIIDEFAVEGVKNGPVFVKRATPELRAQIKELFRL